MATIKLTSGIYGNLINQINGNAAPTSTTGQFQNSFGSAGISIDDDSIPANMLEAAPVFEMNYKGTKKQCVKKAKEQLTIIVKEVVPSILQNSAMITSKIDADAEQLGNLYYEYEKSDKMIQALMETVAHGETQARLFDTYSKMSDSQQKLSAKITETQNQMRKYYIDSYLDLQQKDEFDDNLALPKKEVKAIELVEEEPAAVNGNVIIGTENTVKLLADKKKKALQAKYQEVTEKKE